jgi:hypothetical protein
MRPEKQDGKKSMGEAVIKNNTQGHPRGGNRGAASVPCLLRFFVIFPQGPGTWV